MDFLRRLEEQGIKTQGIIDDALREMVPALTRKLASLPTNSQGFVVTQQALANIGQVLDDITAIYRRSGLETALYKDLLNTKTLLNETVDDLRKRLAGPLRELGELTADTYDSLRKFDPKPFKFLAQGLADQVKDSVVRNVVLGVPLQSLISAAEESMRAAGRNAAADIITAKRQIMQNVENTAAEELGFAKSGLLWEYVGAPLQANSHPECVWALGGGVLKRGKKGKPLVIPGKKNAPYFTNEEKISFEQGGGYTHREPRYRCQHDFLMTAERASGEVKSTPPIPPEKPKTIEPVNREKSLEVQRLKMREMAIRLGYLKKIDDNKSGRSMFVEGMARLRAALGADAPLYAEPYEMASTQGRYIGVCITGYGKDAAATRAKIKSNPLYIRADSKIPDAMKTMWDRAKITHDFVVAKTLEEQVIWTGAHEYAHFYDMQLLRNKFGITTYTGSDNVLAYGSEMQAIFNKYKSEITPIQLRLESEHKSSSGSSGNTPYPRAEGFVSHYAGTNIHEFIAECVSYYIMNGDDNQTASAVWEIFKKAFGG